MELFFRLSLFISGIINLLPSILAFLPNKFSQSYGIEFEDVNLELLLRHRAFLFFIIGGLMIHSSVMKINYEISTISGLFSMISFIVLYFLIDKPINPKLKKVMVIDSIASAILALSSFFYFFPPI
jgi:hypothetical protein